MVSFLALMLAFLLAVNGADCWGWFLLAALFFD